MRDKWVKFEDRKFKTKEAMTVGLSPSTINIKEEDYPITNNDPIGYP